MRELIVKRWFLIALASLILLGFVAPYLLRPYATWHPRRAVVAVVLFFMALPLDATAMWRALRRPQAVTLAVGINFLVVPLLAWPLSRLLAPALADGLIIAAAVPSTLASAAVWTRRAGGNDAISLMVTMITNTACFFVTPLWLFALTGSDVEMDLGQMISRLALLVVAPTVAAQMVRLYRPVAAWAGHAKIPLGVVSQCGILSIVLVGSINAGIQVRESESLAAADWGLMLAFVCGIHLLALAAGHTLGRIAQIDRSDRIAVGFSGSQKTLMIGLHLALAHFGGLATLPMVSYHVCQLLIDTVVADRMAGKSPQSGPERRIDP